MKKLLAFLPAIAFCCWHTAVSQAVGIGTASPNVSAILDVNSTSRGFLPPRMTTAQRQAISNPANGLLVFDTNTRSYWYVSSGVWNELSTAGNVMDFLPAERVDPAGNTGDNYGFSVCLGGDGKRGYIGAPMLGNGGTGKAFYTQLVNDSYWLQSTLSATGLQAGDGFGYAVAMDKLNNGTDGIVSAPFDDEGALQNNGCVFFYRGSASLGKVLPPAEILFNQQTRFGRSVDIAASTNAAAPNNRGYAIVGAPGVNGGQGAAVIYRWNSVSNSWVYDTNLTDNDGAAADSFGVSVSLHYSVTGDTAWAFVGAPYDDVGASTDRGSVTAFRKAAGSTTWVRMAKILPPAGAVGRFGSSIAQVMPCRRVVIGSSRALSGAGDNYTASLTALSESAATFTVNDGPSGPTGDIDAEGGIGHCVDAMAVAGNCNNILAISGSFSGSIGLSFAGSKVGRADLHHATGSTWSFTDMLVDPSAQTTGYGFGRAVSLHTGSGYIVVGAPNHPVDGQAGRGKVQFRRLAY